MYESNLLEGRVVVVTGGGSGLGQAMALRAASVGAKVGVIGRTVSKLEDTVQQIRDAGGTAAYASADVRDPEAVEAAFDALEAELGPADSLINNAAGNFLSASEDLSYNAFNAVVQIVLYGTFNTTMAFGRRRIAAGQPGNIINIETTYAWTGSAFVLPSATAKAGVHAMTKSLAVEWATYGIRVNGIAPGPVPTKGAFSRLMAGGMEEMVLNRIPARRFGDRSEVADVSTFLLAEQTGWITGHTIVLDGGEWLQSGQEFAAPMVNMERAQLKAMFQAMKPSKG